MKKFSKIFFSLIFCLILIGISKNVEANSISKISMDILVNNNGDATVTEVWNCSTNQGTEVYHPYYNLGNSKISNLSVSEGTTKYTTLTSWNTSGSLESKANKCGINQISNGVELCWGISTYGEHMYTIKYTITKFVSELTDSQMVYWTLIPYEFSDTIENVYIKIYTNSKFSNDVEAWGYGNYGGTVSVYDGYIEMQSDGYLNSNEYMTILAQFPLGTFNCTNTLNNDFKYYLDMANQGSTSYTNSSGDTEWLFMLFFISFTVILILLSLKFIGSSVYDDKLSYGPEGKKLPKDIKYFRDIPCKKDIFRAYYIGYSYGLIKNETHLLGAILLKWLKESKIRIEQKEVGSIFKKEDTVIILNETNVEDIENLKEKKLFNMLYVASKDGILQNKEFEKWCSRSYSKILNWFDEILKIERTKLVEEGLITVEEHENFKIFKSKEYITTYALQQEAIELAGLKKYLDDYTLIKDRKAVEVTLFEEYLIYAQLMGCAKKVAKEFKDLYPEIIEQSSFTSYDNIIFVNMCAYNGISHANAAKSRAVNYSSGGGGGGSFGGRWWRWRFPLKYKKYIKIF